MRRAFERQVVMFGLIIALVMAAVPLGASAGHSWGSYHWGRTGNPFTVQLGNNLNGTWSGHLGTASTDWSKSNVLDTREVVPGSGTCQTPTSGRVEVCNADYGAIGWLGLAQIWIGGGHIVQGTAKMNDYYFSMTAYNTPAWRQFVMCQEVGHTFGLGHTDETHANANQGTCMDYTNDPDGGAGGASETDASNEHPNKHDYDQLTKIYRHKDSTTTVARTSSAAEVGLSRAAAANPSGPEQGGVAVFVTELGGGNRVITFVIWADANVIAAAKANPKAPIVDTTTETVEEGYPSTVGSTEFTVGSTVVTADTVNLRVSPSRQADIVIELAEDTVATVTGPIEQAQGVNWVPVTVETPDGTLAGYVAADFITPAELAV
jgi:hypothetical protein